MSALRSKPMLRWLAPLSAALAVIGGGVAIGALTAAADRSPPPRSAAQLLVDLATARLDGLSGTVVQRADLGLPPLPDLGGQGSADISSLLTGTHTLRVWYSGPDKARIALLGTVGETDVITNGSDLWIWDSRQNTVTHRTLQPREAGKDLTRPTVPLPTALPTSMPFTPDMLANAALAAIEPTTAVTTSGPVKVAGRDAYELNLAPRDTASLIGSVRLAIDATEHLPLRMQIFPRGSDNPAIEVAFTQVSFERPNPEQFVFNPPPGATIVEQSQPDATKPDATKPDATKPDATKPDHAGPGVDRSGVAVVGKGWTSVLVARLPVQSADPEGTSERGNGFAGLARVLESLPKVSGAWGSGRVLTSTLFSILVTDDGRVLVGAVSPDRLYLAAADPAAALPTSS